MKLLRLVTAYFDPELEGWTSWSSKIGRVTVRARPTNRTDVAPAQAKGGSLLTAEIDLASLPTIAPDGLLDIPDQERRLCEQAIETTANLMAVLTRSPRRLASPWPPVALLPESAEEWERLEEARAFRYSTPSSANAVPLTPKLEPKLMVGLTDRLGGVQAVATFIAQVQPLSRYREAVRFFEMAFARPVSAIEKKLSQFLASGRFGYTRDEVAEWLSHRHGSVHGDGRPSEDLVWDADVARFMDRIEQALYDVLLNKAGWHSPSQNRRDLWRPLAGTLDNQGGIFGTQSTGMTISFQIFDGFQSYPHDLSANLTKVPEEWWCRFPDDLSGRTGEPDEVATSPSAPLASGTDTVSAPPHEDPHH